MSWQRKPGAVLVHGKKRAGAGRQTWCGNGSRLDMSLYREMKTLNNPESRVTTLRPSSLNSRGATRHNKACSGGRCHACTFHAGSRIHWFEPNGYGTHTHCTHAHTHTVYMHTYRREILHPSCYTKKITKELRPPLNLHSHTPLRVN